MSVEDEVRKLHDELHGTDCRCAWVLAQERYGNQNAQQVLEQFQAGDYDRGEQHRPDDTQEWLDELQKEVEALPDEG